MAKDLSTERVTAAFALVQYCKAEGVVSVAEAAEHFGVTPKWIRDTMQWIFMTGLPQDLGDPVFFDFNWEAFEEESLIEMRDIPALEDATVKLTAREAAIVVTGLQMLSPALPDMAESIARLIEKIRAVTMGDDITMAVQGIPVADDVRLVRTAIRERVGLEFQYRKPDSRAETRRILPRRIVMADDERILVQGHDADRGAERTFRLDRVSDMHVTELPEPASPSGAEPEAAIDVIVVEADHVAALQLQAFAPETTVNQTGTTTFRIPVWNIETVLRAVMATGGGARIVEPEAARISLAALAKSAMR